MSSSDKDDKYSTPSLLEPESRGGDTAEGGFSFQDGVILASIPHWLAHESFAAFIRESIGDVECRFFTPSAGELIDAIEAKNHHITPAPFWEEIDRFQEMAAAAEYRNFRLVCTSLSAEIDSICKSMKRVRDAIPFYPDASTVGDNSLADFVKMIEAKGRTKADAEFLLNRVEIDGGWTSSRDFAEGMFQQAAAKWIPGFEDLPARKIQNVFSKLLTIVRSRLNQPITRGEIEATVCAALEDDLFFNDHRIQIETTTTTFTGSPTAMQFDWESFFGRDSRSYPNPEKWQCNVIDQLAASRNWIGKNRRQRRILLRGERRLSTAIAIGHGFPAVSGFNIDVDYRGGIWSSDAHPEDSDAYKLEIEHSEGDNSDLVLEISLIRDISRPVQTAKSTLGLESSEHSRVFGVKPITSDRQANWIVQSIKRALEQRVNESGVETIHLFYAGPSPLILFFGHRLNATATIKCYEWTGNAYVPTCQLVT